MHSRHNEVRQVYSGRCGYCGASEVSTGGELTVDHFRPLAEGGDDSLVNLVYCCFRCNLVKATYWAPEGTDGALLHPLMDALDEHIRLDMGNGLLVPLTKRGEVQIETLHLNRPALIARRIEDRCIELLKAEVLNLRREKQLRATAITDLEQARRSLGWMVEMESLGGESEGSKEW